MHEIAEVQTTETRRRYVMNVEMDGSYFGGFQIDAEVVFSVDRPIAVESVTLRRHADSDVTATMLRYLAAEWDDLVALWSQDYSPDTDLGPAAREQVERAKLDRAMGDPVARREMNVDHLERVAEVYRDATASGRSGLTAIMRHFPGRGGRRVAKSTAARWVKEARRLGLLEERP